MSLLSGADFRSPAATRVASPRSWGESLRRLVRLISPAPGAWMRPDASDVLDGFCCKALTDAGLADKA